MVEEKILITIVFQHTSCGFLCSDENKKVEWTDEVQNGAFQFPDVRCALTLAKLKVIKINGEDI